MVRVTCTPNEEHGTPGMELEISEITPEISAAAAALGRRGAAKGGRSTSEAKRAAARANGRLGGRPRKKTEGIEEENLTPQNDPDTV